jgi:signal transduction histidine kinase
VLSRVLLSIVLLGGLLHPPVGQAATDWESVREELKTSRGAPASSRLSGLRALREGGAPWSAVDTCRFALTEAFILWDLGRLAEARSVLATAVESQGATDEADPHLLGLKFHCRGLAAFLDSSHPEAMRLLEQALPQLRQSGQPLDLASGLMSYAEVAMLLGAKGGARDAYLEARELYTAAGESLQAAMLDVTLLGMEWDTAKEKAQRNAAFFEAMELFRAANDREAIVYGTIALVNNSMLPPADLLKILDDVEPIVEANEDLISIFSFAHLRLELYFEMKDYAAAAIHGRRALALANTMGDRDYQCWVLVDLGWALLELGHPEQLEEVEEMLLQGKRMSEEKGFPLYKAWADVGLARLAYARDELVEAQRLAESALTFFEEYESVELHGKALSILARVVSKRGDPERAHELMRKAFDLIEANADPEYHRMLAETSAQYEDELKNNALRLAEIERSTAQRQITLQNEKLELVDTLRKRDQRFRNLGLASGSIGALLALILGVLLFQMRKAAKRVESLNAALQAEKEALAFVASQREETNEELLAANFRLKLLDEERKSLLGMAAHDMRNPVGAIQSSLDLLDSELDKGEGADQSLMREYRNLAVEASNILLENIERIIAARQQQSMEVELDLRSINPRPLIEQTLQLNLVAALRKEMRIEFPESPPVEVNADPQTLRTALDNLVSNAIKYSFPGALITIRVEPTDEGKAVRICIEDGGPGIPEAELDRLFEPFAVLSNRPTGGEGSVGLGLASVKSSIERMGGAVEVENRQDRKGARFSILLAGQAI